MNIRSSFLMLFRTVILNGKIIDLGNVIFTKERKAAKTDKTTLQSRLGNEIP